MSSTDIDSLLDEIDGSLGGGDAKGVAPRAAAPRGSGTSYAAPPAAARRPASDSKAGPRSELDEIESLLADTADAPVLAAVSRSAHAGAGVSSSGRPTAGAATGAKCSTLYLFPQASLSSHAVKVCTGMACTACDFRVLRFGDAAWAQGVDYMFFRNNMPSQEKLSVALVRSPGAGAYCCQCSWASVLPGDGATGVCIRRGGVPSQSPAPGTPLAARVGGAGWAHWSCRGE